MQVSKKYHAFFWGRAILNGILLAVVMHYLGWPVLLLWLAIGIATLPNPYS